MVEHNGNGWRKMSIAAAIFIPPAMALLMFQGWIMGRITNLEVDAREVRTKQGERTDRISNLEKSKEEVQRTLAEILSRLPSRR